MALTDFLGKDVGGYAQGPMPDGQAGVPRAGVNWGQLLQSLVNVGSRPGSAAPMLTGMIGQKVQPQVQQVPPMMQPAGQQRKGSDMSDLKDIMEVGSFLFGFGA